MPKSKRPRKPHRARWVHRPLPQQVVKEITDKFTNVQLAMELKLHLGQCSLSELDSAIDLFNLAGLSVIHRKLQLEDGMEEVFNAGVEALVAVRTRGLTLSPTRFVCTAEERNAILNGLEAIGQYLVDEATDDASRLMLEWKASLIYGGTNGTVNTSEKA